MRGVTIDIERIAVSLHGISSDVVEGVLSELEEEVEHRLGIIPFNVMESIYIDDLALSAVHKEAVLDQAALRGIIADRLVEAIRQTGTAAVINREGET